MLQEMKMAIVVHQEEAMVSTIDHLENISLPEVEEVLQWNEVEEETSEVPKRIKTVVMIGNKDHLSFEAIVEGEEVSVAEVGAEEVNPAQIKSLITKVDMKSSRELVVATHLSELKSYNTSSI